VRVLEDSRIDALSDSDIGSDAGSVDVEQPMMVPKLSRDQRRLVPRGSNAKIGLTFGKGKSRRRLLAPIFEHLCLFGGIGLYKPTGVWADLTRFWRYALRACYIVVLAMNIAGHLVNDTRQGPYFGHHLATIEFDLFILSLLMSPMLVLRVLHSKDFLGMLRRWESNSSREFADTVYRHSKLISYGIVVLGSVTGVVLLVGFLPLVFHSYNTSHSAVWPRIWSTITGTIFVLFSLPVPVAGLATGGMMYLLIALASQHLFASLDTLHPQIEELGLHRWAKVCSKRLIIQEQSLVLFNEAFNDGLKTYAGVQRSLGPVFFFLALPSVLGLCLPLALWFDGWNIHNTGTLWAEALVYLLMYMLGILTLSCYHILLPLYFSVSLAGMQQTLRSICCESPNHRIFLDRFTYKHSCDLTFRLGNWMPVEPLTALASLLVMLASAAPVFFLVHADYAAR